MGLPIPRILVSVAAALLLAATAYGALGAQPEDRVDPWTRPREGEVESGNCSRTLRLLPSTKPPVPDFIRFRGATYVRAGGVIPTPPDLAPLPERQFRHRYRDWRLRRGDGMLYLETELRGGVVLPGVIPYARGECP